MAYQIIQTQSNPERFTLGWATAQGLVRDTTISPHLTRYEADSLMKSEMTPEQFAEWKRSAKPPVGWAASPSQRA